MASQPGPSSGGPTTTGARSFRTATSAPLTVSGGKPGSSPVQGEPVGELIRHGTGADHKPDRYPGQGDFSRAALELGRCGRRDSCRVVQGSQQVAICGVEDLPGSRVKDLYLIQNRGPGRWLAPVRVRTRD